MGLTQLNFEGQDRVGVALDRLRYYCPPEGYFLAFSGGKDSMVIYDLALRAGVDFDAHYNVSPIDPPELMRFIRTEYPDVQWDIHARGFWRRFMSEGPPMRIARWCCEMIKESGGTGRSKLLGLRREESRKRARTQIYEPCYNDVRTFRVSPIADWSEADVWEYIRGRGLRYCGLYDDGFRRLGCVLCPYHSTREALMEIARFPKISETWRRALGRYWEVRRERGTPLPYATAAEFWHWWINER